MSKYAALEFQRKAIDELTENFKKLWTNSETQRPILFESPTGSGKTFMMCQFINGMNRQPNWDDDKAFIWITFSEDLAMQSKAKFKEYFFPNIENGLLTVEDFREGKLKKNDILFLNWQKVTSKAAENRKLRRPDSDTMYKESGYYFEDIIENTKAEGRELVLIIDESHLHDSVLAKQIIDIINPKIVMYISATPKAEQIPSGRAMQENKAAHVYAKREDVISEGLIKERVVTQTEEDLQQYEGGDADEILLDLAIAKREQLVAELKKINKTVNPLVLIQLPNDTKDLKAAGQQTKEEIVTAYLLKKGIAKEKIALKFDSRSENMEMVTRNDSEIDFMLFKLAAATGWDCPRAHVLVMYREVKTPTFLTQIIGRILRMPEPQFKADYKNSSMLKTGYLFTNYKRNEIKIPEQSESNKQYIFTSKRKEGVTNIALQSDFVPRLDYGDLVNAVEFQASFLKSFNTFFEIDYMKDVLLEQRSNRLAAKGIDLAPIVSNQVIVDAVFSDYDKLDLEYRKQGKDRSMALSAHDIEKMFNYACFQLLREQTEIDAKVSNVARSWGPLKSAFRVWFTQNISADSTLYYKILIADLQKESGSIFRQALTRALKEYRPIQDELRKNRKKEQAKKEAPIFTIQNEYSYTEDYEKHDTKISVLEELYLLKDYKGIKNEIAFVKYIDEKSEKLEWWFKNGASGKDAYCFKYLNTAKQEESLFYPDWILKFKDGTIGIFDTKSGFTATHTEGRAEALAQKIIALNAEGTKAIGGIAVLENNQWYYNNVEKYEYVKGRLNEDWEVMEGLF